MKGLIPVTADGFLPDVLTTLQFTNFKWRSSVCLLQPHIMAVAFHSRFLRLLCLIVMLGMLLSSLALFDGVR